MATHTAAGLREPRSCFEAPDKYYDYMVCDPEGRKIGRVKELFANVQGESQYIRVRVDFFGLRSVLIPVCFVVVDEQRRSLTLH